jgi:pimeloyl-ACP methyl ester carboxylesterase
MQRERVRTDIDKCSYLVTYNSDDTKIVVVFIHGIFGHYEETWQSTPSCLMTFPIMAQADWGSFGYRTKLVDFTTAGGLEDQLVLWARTHLNRYEQIYFVAHSMGGLIARNACAKLALSDDAEDQRLFSRIKQCFLIAVPLAGARVAKVINRLPLLKKLNWRIPYLAQPEISRSSLHHYDAAIRRATHLGLPRPTFSIFVGTADRLVNDAEAWAVTRDDKYEGPVEGTHESIKSDVDVNSTLIKRIVQAVNSHTLRDSETQREKLQLENRIRSRQIPQGNISDNRARSVRNARQPNCRDVVLLSCSFQKRTDREEFHPRMTTISNSLQEPKVALLALRTRVQIMNLIQQGRIVGTEFKEGNRLARNQNRQLILGPDFGGGINEARYLPAYWRYSGRSYQATEQEWRDFLRRGETERPDVIIMSGLYGLLPMEEQIQNYDCHMTDTDSETGQTVRGYWGSVMTEVLISRLEWLEERGWEIGRIVDLLSERSYQTAIDWQRVYPRWNVLHRMFERKAGREALENLGVFVRRIIQDPSTLAGVKADDFIADANFLGDDRIAFESRLQESKLAVARE